MFWLWITESSCLKACVYTHTPYFNSIYNGNNLNVYFGLVNKLWYIHTTEYHPATKHKTVEQCSWSWKDNTTTNKRTPTVAKEYTQYPISIKKHMDPYTYVGEKARRFYQNVSSHCLSVVRLQVSVCLSLSVPDLIPIPKFYREWDEF